MRQKIKITEPQLFKILVNESNGNGLHESFKVDGSEFNVIKLDSGTIYVGKDGILGHNRIIIPWDLINKIINKYK